MSFTEFETHIRIFGESAGEYLSIMNGADEDHILVCTDVDQRQIQININELKKALRKMTV